MIAAAEITCWATVAYLLFIGAALFIHKFKKPTSESLPRDQ